MQCTGSVRRIARETVSASHDGRLSYKGLHYEYDVSPDCPIAHVNSPSMPRFDAPFARLVGGMFDVMAWRRLPHGEWVCDVRMHAHPVRLVTLSPALVESWTSEARRVGRLYASRVQVVGLYPSMPALCVRLMDCPDGGAVGFAHPDCVVDANQPVPFSSRCEANVVCVNFPVPLESCYDAGKADGRLLRHERRDASDRPPRPCVYTRREAEATFEPAPMEAVSRAARPSSGEGDAHPLGLVRLRRGVFEGCERTAHLLRVDPDTGEWTVRHTLDPRCLWRLPRAVWSDAGVPLPLVFARRPIVAGEELLLLARRAGAAGDDDNDAPGGGAASVEFGPMWDVFLPPSPAARLVG